MRQKSVCIRFVSASYQLCVRCRSGLCPACASPVVSSMCPVCVQCMLTLNPVCVHFVSTYDYLHFWLKSMSSLSSFVSSLCPVCVQFVFSLCPICVQFGVQFVSSFQKRIVLRCTFETGHKPDTNRTQTGHKPDTNRTKTGHKLNTNWIQA